MAHAQSAALAFRLETDKAAFDKGDAEAFEDSPYDEPLYLETKALLTGANLTCVAALENPYAGWGVTFVLDEAGSQTLAAVTRENIGKRFGIVLNGQLLWAPHIQSEVPGPQLDMSGPSAQQAEETVRTLQKAMPDLAVCEDQD